MSVSRRGFLGLFAGALAASAINGSASVIAPAEPIQPSVPPAGKLRARHVYQYDIHSDQLMHRVDVIVTDPKTCQQAQYRVDFMCDSVSPSTAHWEPALWVLARHIECEHGENFDMDIRTFKPDQWDEGSRWLGRLGDVPD